MTARQQQICINSSSSAALPVRLVGQLVCCSASISVWSIGRFTEYRPDTGYSFVAGSDRIRRNGWMDRLRQWESDSVCRRRRDTSVAVVGIQRVRACWQFGARSDRDTMPRRRQFCCAVGSDLRRKSLIMRSVGYVRRIIRNTPDMPPDGYARAQLDSRVAGYRMDRIRLRISLRMDGCRFAGRRLRTGRIARMRVWTARVVCMRASERRMICVQDVRDADNSLPVFVARARVSVSDSLRAPDCYWTSCSDRHCRIMFGACSSDGYAIRRMPDL